jgi:hypothetical protein
VPNVTHLEEIIAFIATILTGLTGTGAVHDHEPIATAPEEIPAVFGASQQVNAWTITVSSTTEEELTNIEVLRHHVFTVRLYVEVGDAAVTALQARALSEAAMTAFRPHYQILDATETVVLAELFGPMQRPLWGHTLLGSTVLTHFGEHTLAAQELIRLS